MDDDRGSAIRIAMAREGIRSVRDLSRRARIKYKKLDQLLNRPSYRAITDEEAKRLLDVLNIDVRDLGASVSS